MINAIASPAAVSFRPKQQDRRISLRAGAVALETADSSGKLISPARRCDCAMEGEAAPRILLLFQAFPDPVEDTYCASSTSRCFSRSDTFVRCQAVVVAFGLRAA